jgi:methionyl-tRNA formyltransferase
MKLVVLTTETLHHAYFVRELQRAHPIAEVLVETEARRAPFPTAHPFEITRDQLEREVFFGGQPRPISAFAPCQEWTSMNRPEAVAALARARPDVVVVFGTGKLSPEVIAVCPQGIINLHGGDPEEYRGLDTHLWAIYHRDFANLVVCLHRLNARLDDGEILARAPIPVSPGLTLPELRARNTQVCVELTRQALDEHARTGSFTTTPQARIGRYYSFMPAVLKDLCVANFERFTRAST